MFGDGASVISEAPSLATVDSEQTDITTATVGSSSDVGKCY